MCNNYSVLHKIVRIYAINFIKKKNQNIIQHIIGGNI